MSASSRVAISLLMPGALALAAACVPPPRMCAQESDCGSQSSCVAGRCVAHGATAAIDGARRLLVEPVEVGWVQRGSDVRGAPVATLGRAGEPAALFLRFDAELPGDASVLEAYVLLERAAELDADPSATIAVHAARVVSPWDARSLTWATQPRVLEVGAPVTRVGAGAGRFVRVDVRDIVQRWRRRGRDEQGIAVVVEGESATGLAFALAAVDVGRDRDDPVLAPRRQQAGPRLELYVK